MKRQQFPPPILVIYKLQLSLISYMQIQYFKKHIIFYSGFSKPLDFTTSTVESTWYWTTTSEPSWTTTSEPSRTTTSEPSWTPTSWPWTTTSWSWTTWTWTWTPSTSTNTAPEHNHGLKFEADNFELKAGHIELEIH